ncbi:MAG: GDSL-type esterase/lipase family protein [Treponema sp.]|nr:GDSL-type esterase/lipase family protein [Treponema sp.]
MNHKNIMLLLALAALLAGCNMFTGSDRQETGRSGISQINVTIGSSGRTILPELGSGFSKFVISAEPVAGNSQTPPSPVDITTGSQGVITLPFGDWNIIVSGYVTVSGDDYEAATGSAPLTVNSSSHSVQVLLNLPGTNGTGTFTYTVTFPAGGSASVKLEPWPLGGTPEVDAPVAASGTPVIQSNIPGGIYFLTVTVTVGTKTSIRNEIVHIYPHLTSNASYSFADPNKSQNTQRLMNYLTNQYGKKIISGQMDVAWEGNSAFDMIARVYSDTGKYPAIKGFDFIQLPYSNYIYAEGQQQIDEAIEWWNGMNNGVKLLAGKPDIHGIVTFCWHWRMPQAAGTEPAFYTQTGNGSNYTNYRIPWTGSQLDTANAAFQNIQNDLDAVAALLQQLKDLDIPVLWRPLHEAAGNWSPTNPNGAWFWWGGSGPAPYIALWEYMHDYFTNTKGLDNLIWVWNGQRTDWYPDPETVDIAGFDYYPYYNGGGAQDGQTWNKTVFDNTLAMTGGSRMVALTENGVMPDPDHCLANNAMWSWFMTWNDHNNPVNTYSDQNFWTGGFHNTNSHKAFIYNHDLVITLDELPDLTKYNGGSGEDPDDPDDPGEPPNVKTLIPVVQTATDATGSNPNRLIDGLFRGPLYWGPGRDLPKWAALRVDGDYSEIILYWTADNENHPLPAPGNDQYGAPTAYFIEISADSTNGTDGNWTTVVNESNNLWTSRSHRISFTNQRWVRFNVTGDAYTVNDGVRMLEIELHDNTYGKVDGWLFFGDSNTAMGFTRSADRTPAFANIVEADDPTHYPMQFSAGLGGDNAQNIERLRTTLNTNEGFRVVVLSLGTNAINGNYTNQVAYQNQMRALVDEVHGRGMIAVVPRLLWPNGAYTNAAAEGMNDRIVELSNEANGPILGPNLYSEFLNKTHLFRAANDVHPNAAGYKYLQEVWGNWYIAAKANGTLPKP